MYGCGKFSSTPTGKNLNIRGVKRKKRRGDVILWKRPSKHCSTGTIPAQYLLPGWY